jgi:hypothetical protein
MKTFEDRVAEAFHEVRLPDELITMRTTETEAIEAALRPLRSWRQVPQRFMEEFASALTLTRSEVFPFLLPAFMLHGMAFSTEEEDDAICLRLGTPQGEPESEEIWREKLALLTRTQRAQLLEYLTAKAKGDKFSLAAAARHLVDRLDQEMPEAP